MIYPGAGRGERGAASIAALAVLLLVLLAGLGLWGLAGREAAGGEEYARETRLRFAAESAALAAYAEIAEEPARASDYQRDSYSETEPYIPFTARRPYAAEPPIEVETSVLYVKEGDEAGRLFIQAAAKLAGEDGWEHTKLAWGLAEKEAGEFKFVGWRKLVK